MMPADLSDLYAALARDARATPLAPPESLRHGADRRARRSAATLFLAVFLVVGGTAFAAKGLLARARPAPVVGTPTQSTEPGIPDRAFFTPPPERTGGSSVPAPVDGAGSRLTWCGHAFPDGPQTGVLVRTRTVAYVAVNAGPGAPVAGTVQETIIFDPAGQGLGLMADLRAAMTACPSEAVDGATVTYSGAPGGRVLGEDWLLIQQTRTPPAGSPGLPVTTLISAVRSSGFVTLLIIRGAGGLSADRALADDYSYRALAAAWNWRHPA